MFNLDDYLSEARRLEQQGEVVEAIWCYDTVLRDKLVLRTSPTFQAASVGLALLLLSEIPASIDPVRKARLINRAVSVLTTASQHTAEPAMALKLAEAHIIRFDLLAETRDLLAANMQLDQLADHDNPDVLDAVRHLRARLSRPKA